MPHRRKCRWSRHTGSYCKVSDMLGQARNLMYSRFVFQALIWVGVMGVPASAGRPRCSSPQWLPPAPPEEPGGVPWPSERHYLSACCSSAPGSLPGWTCRNASPGRCPGGIIGPNQLSKCGGVITLKQTPLTRPWLGFVNDKYKENAPKKLVFFLLFLPHCLLYFVGVRGLVLLYVALGFSTCTFVSRAEILAFSGRIEFTPWKQKLKKKKKIHPLSVSVFLEIVVPSVLQWWDCLL